MTQGKLKTLLRPTASEGPFPTTNPSAVHRRRGSTERRTLPAPHRGQVHLDHGEGHRGLHPFLAKESGQAGESFSPSSGQQLQAWAMIRLIRFHDLEIPVQTSQSSPGPGPAPEGECVPPQGARSPKILAHLARSAGAPAAVGLPWGSHHTPTANMGIGKRGRL